MQITKKRIGALVLAACLLAVLAFGGAMAWAKDSQQGGENSLTVKATSSTDQAFVEDIAKAKVQVDVYQVADATNQSPYDTYRYALRSPYKEAAGLEDLMKAALDPDNKEKTWQDFSDEAIKYIGSDSAVVTDVPVEEAITNMADGLFLVIAHGEGIEATRLIADSAMFRYTFQPTTVALPSKEPDADGNIHSDDSYGPWLREVTISLKPEQTPLYGSLIINKKILSIEGTMSNWKKASFFYHIVSTADSPYDYDNWASATVTGEGDFQAPPVRHIKAGTIVKVTEVYEGADFKAVGSTVSDPVTIVADNDDGTWPAEVAQVYFTNTSDTEIKEGSGIQNEFTLDNNGDWKPVVTPEGSDLAESAA